MVSIIRDGYGRGPTKAKTYAFDDLLVVVMRGSGFTPLEQTMMDSGEPDRVVAMRYDFQRAMAGRFVETVEKLAGRNVVAFLSQVDVEPDVTMEIFFLDRPLEGFGALEQSVLRDWRGNQSSRRTPVTILMADDDEDDRELAREALQDERLANELRFAVDGQDLMDYLRRESRYADPAVDAPTPAIILLDLNMPKKDGRAALAEIKADPELRQIPVVVLTTSNDEQEMLRCYELGANSFITKPDTAAGWVAAMRFLARYWFDLAGLPARSNSKRRD